MQDRATPQFTNLDWRMRPVDAAALGAPTYAQGSRMRVWNATPDNFPALNAVVQREARALGLGSVRLIIDDGNQSARYYDVPSGPIISLSIDFLNRARFADVRSVLGHELGHGVRRARYSDQDSQDFRHREEYAADLSAACQLGSVDSIIRSLRTAFGNPTSSRTHPSSSERIAHLEQHRDEVRNPMLGGAQNICRAVSRPGMGNY